jgi:exonuclease VII small subunit
MSLLDIIPGGAHLKAAVSIGALVVVVGLLWKLEIHGYSRAMDKVKAQVALDQIGAAKERIRAFEAGIALSNEAETILKGKTDALAKIKANNAGLNRELARVLDAANQCGNEAMRAGEAPGGYDGRDTGRYVVERR